MSEFLRRSTTGEQMDVPGHSLPLIQAVFRDINSVNRYLGGNRISHKAVLRMMKAHPRSEYKFMDMGCGDGLLLRQLARICREKEIKATFLGLDFNGQAIALCREASREYPEMRFRQADIRSSEGIPECDILLCSLTLHHFGQKEIPLLLSDFSGLSRIGIILNDLQRNKWAYYLFKGFSAIFMNTKIAREDGLVSIKRGFTREELLQYAHAMPHLKHSIRRKLGFRYLWTMEHLKMNTAHE